MVISWSRQPENNRSVPYSPYRDNPSTPPSPTDRVRLITPHSDADLEEENDNSDLEQNEFQGRSKNKFLQEALFKAGNIASQLGTWSKKGDGIRKSLNCCFGCCKLLGIVVLILIFWIGFSIYNARRGPLPTVEWIGANQHLTIEPSTPLAIEHTHSSPLASQAKVTVDGQFDVVSTNGKDVQVDFVVTLTDGSMMDLVKVDRGNKGQIKIMTSSIPTSLKVKAPRIHIVGTLSLPDSSSFSSLSLSFSNFPISISKEVSASTDKLFCKSGAGNIKNKSKNFHAINTTKLELGAGEIGGKWTLSREDFEVQVKAGEIDIDLYAPSNINYSDVAPRLSTDISAGPTKFHVHSSSVFPPKLISSHRGGAGSMHLHYPATWAGMINISDKGMGKVDIEGDDDVKWEVLTEERGRMSKVRVGGDGGEAELDIEQRTGRVEIDFEN